MRRREVITLLSGAAAAWPVRAWTQDAHTMRRLCFLTFDPAATLGSSRFAPFFEALRHQGYVDGQNIKINYLSAQGDSERFPTLAAECLRLNSDLIVATTTPAAQAAKNATRTVPILFTALGDPVGIGLVDSLARPGRNVTGMSAMFPELGVKRLQLLTQAMPGISRVLVLAYLDDPIAHLQVEALEAATHDLGVTLQIQDIQTPDHLPRAFEAAAKGHAQGLLTTAESMFSVHGAKVTELAAWHGLPAIYAIVQNATDRGGLMAYAPDSADLHQRAAGYAVRILEGANPADLPIQQPTRFKFVINLKTAKALGLTIPDTLLARADEVIE